VLVADRDAWFTYYYWLDEARAPDFARRIGLRYRAHARPEVAATEVRDLLLALSGIPT
jgi:hypothetical protein